MKEFKGDDMGDLVKHTLNLTSQYNICAARHKALIDVVESAKAG